MSYADIVSMPREAFMKVAKKTGNIEGNQIWQVKFPTLMTSLIVGAVFLTIVIYWQTLLEQCIQRIFGPSRNTLGVHLLVALALSVLSILLIRWLLRWDQRYELKTLAPPTATDVCRTFEECAAEKSPVADRPPRA